MAGGLLGRFVAQCGADGSYKPVQCHEGYCWCVDKGGREINNTRGRAQPNCASNGNQNGKGWLWVDVQDLLM